MAKKTPQKNAEEQIEEARQTGATTLDLSELGLTAVPESTANLSQLQTLNLGENQLTTMPESLGQLTRLQHLNLSYNQLTTVPESLGQLTQLQHLNLGENQLTTVPESLGQLTQLQHLNLSGNQLTTVPASLGQLTQLQELYLHDNDVLGIPPEVLGPTSREVHGTKKSTPASPAAILRYYVQSRQARRPLNEAKLILVGYGAVGKTSLVNRLVHNTFQPGEAQTEGINITQWPLRLHNAENIRLHVWDFGGQEIMHATLRR